MHPHPTRVNGGDVADDRYEIRVRGRVGKRLLASFHGFDAEVEPVETILRGTVRDQSALHGVLEQIQAFGLELVELRQVGTRRRRITPGSGA
jgi:hypothetical protein